MAAMSHLGVHLDCRFVGCANEQVHIEAIVLSDGDVFKDLHQLRRQLLPSESRPHTHTHKYSSGSEHKCGSHVSVRLIKSSAQSRQRSEAFVAVAR